MTSQQPENDILTTHYFKLCSTLSDIDDLLPHFVANKIIHINDVQQIKANVLPTDKVANLMKHISRPLDAGNTEVFYTMLRIMQEYGHQATQHLADQMRKSLPVADESGKDSDRHSKL